MTKGNSLSAIDRENQADVVREAEGLHVKVGHAGRAAQAASEARDLASAGGAA